MTTATLTSDRSAGLAGAPLAALGFAGIASAFRAALAQRKRHRELAALDRAVLRDLGLGDDLVLSLKSDARGVQYAIV